MSVLTAEEYVDSLYIVDEELAYVEKTIREQGMPEISVKPGYGRLLTLLAKMAAAHNILEIGALGGYSGICLARGLSEDGKLISLELKQAYADLAHENLKRVGFGDKVAYRIGEALDNLQALKEERVKFDLFFIDADKSNYSNYLEWAIQLANPGAIIVGDNTLMHDKVLDPSVSAKNVRKVREFNQRIATDPRLDSTMLPAYDGLAIARVK